MDRDALNNEFYNAFGESFDKIPFKDVLISLLVNYLPKAGCDILEIGSGPGALALWMTKFGHHVTCVEPAEKPAKKAREKGLNVYQTRFQDFTAPQNFDSIIAMSSLIHIPRTEMPLQIQKMSQLLKPDGVALLSFIEGDSEAYEDPTGAGKNRFFSRFTQDELNVLLTPYFSIVEIQKIKGKSINQWFLLLVLKLVDQ